METEIKSIFSKKLITISDLSSLAYADDMMNNYNIRHLPVVDTSDTLVGILSKSDYLALKYVDSRLQKLTVKHFMSSPVVAVAKTTKINEVAQIFINKKISSVVIVEDNVAIGIATSEDLIKILAKNKNFVYESEHLDLTLLSDEGWISMTTAQ